MVRTGRSDGTGRRREGVAAGSNTNIPVSGGVGVAVAGSFGVLTLNADGSYSYVGNPNVVPPAGATDTFVYTMGDGDGDDDTTTLTITLTDAGLVAPADGDVTVNESALDLTATGSDLAPGTVTGSLPGSANETDATATSSTARAAGAASYALQTGGNAATAGLFGTIQVNSDGSYTYTLTAPFDTTPDADDGANTELAESFSYVVTDVDGNTATGTHHGQHRRRRCDGGIGS